MLSRRHFLQLAGIAVAARYLPNLTAPDSASAPSFDAVYGRALGSTPVYAAPSLDAPILRQMWSDTVAPIMPTGDGWYGLCDGYAWHEDLQPMIERAHGTKEDILPPAWTEVSGAIAVVRAWCAVNAPVVARIGHGGVMRIIDQLPAESSRWYGVADSENSDLLGWSLAVWSPVQVDAVSPYLTLVVDSATQQMTVRDGDRTLLTSPISTGRDLLPGVYPIIGRQMTLPQPDYHGAPYALAFGDDLHLAGAYWHNRFGRPTPGAALQVMPALARWLYPRAAEVIIS
jgi:hypothetical protein